MSIGLLILIAALLFESVERFDEFVGDEPYPLADGIRPDSLDRRSASLNGIVVSNRARSWSDR